MLKNVKLFIKSVKWFKNCFFKLKYKIEFNLMIVVRTFVILITRGYVDQLSTVRLLICFEVKRWKKKVVIY